MMKDARVKGEKSHLKNFEAMDMIHEKMRYRAEEGLIKLEPLIKKQLHSLYNEKKPNIYSLTQEKKRHDEANIERLIKKTQVPTNRFNFQDEELQRLIKTHKIDIKSMKLPYSMKIKQICAQMTAFYRYKRD